MNKEFGMKELYFAQLKTTSNIEIDGNYLIPGETVATFDKIQISHFKEMEEYHVELTSRVWERRHSSNQ